MGATLTNHQRFTSSSFRSNRIKLRKMEKLGVLASAFRKLEVRARTLWKNKIEFSMVVSVFMFGFMFYSWIFLRNELIPMIDRPYYLIQVKSLLTTGGLVYGDPPLTFYLLSFFSIIFGDIMLGVKVGVSFFCALSTIPAYFLMKRIGKGTFAGITAMLLIIFSAPYIRMLTDFMKNAIGVCWLIAFIYYLHELAFAGFKKRSLTLATFFLILTGLTHILVFGVALLFLPLYTVAVLIFNVNRRSFLKAVSIIALAIGTFVFIASTFFGSLFTDFGKIFRFLSELTAHQGSVAQALLPANLGPSQRPRPFGPGIPSSLSIVGGWGVILLILSVGVVLSIYVWKKKEKEALLLLTVTTIIGSVLCFPLIPNEWLSRFLLMIVVPTAIILSYGISKIWNLHNENSKVMALALAVICFSFFIAQSFGVATSIDPTISNAGYLDLVNMKDQIRSDSIIVVPRQHGMGYWIQYVEDVDILGMGEELSPDLWQSYSYVLGVFFKREVPHITFKTVFVGDVFILVELQQNNYITS